MKTTNYEEVLGPLDVEPEQLRTDPGVVRIPAYPNMQEGDVITLHWGGAGCPEELDPKLEFDVGSTALENADGGHISVTYTVQRKMS